ncbi:putative ribonuclease H-like domain-containing protein [Senna tora]|uniref:Putative ribonuclease H-like domain-containing protein n=1 Tax=Senna tora TaxID=362788 RepID=A0A834WZ18_9FABA|nr:putative ribonuclease H-like domain-containing protein [Senna tora]
MDQRGFGVVRYGFYRRQSQKDRDVHLPQQMLAVMISAQSVLLHSCKHHSYQKDGNARNTPDQYNREFLQDQWRIQNASVSSTYTNTDTWGLCTYRCFPEKRIRKRLGLLDYIALDQFLRCFGLSINESKSYIWFSPNTDNVTKADVLNTLRFKVVTTQGTYLGFPLGLSNRTSDYKPFMDKVIGKMENRKAKFLSKAGKVTLINSVSTPCWKESNEMDKMAWRFSTSGNFNITSAYLLALTQAKNYAQNHRDNFDTKWIWSLKCHTKHRTANLSRHVLVVAMATGLELAINLNCRKLIVEADSLVAVNLVAENKCVNTHHLATLIKFCRSKLKNFVEVHVSHIHREGNACADLLAKQANENYMQMTYLPNLPSSLSSQFLADQVGISFTRNAYR